MNELDQLTGSRIDDRFELRQLIGQGASGVVYRAVDPNGLELALKLVEPTHGTDRASARYLRGTRLASKLKHPHIVGVIESGRWGPRRRCYYLAMELVRGVSLGLIRFSDLSPRQAVGLISQILEAAVYVHARGTIHRDLKPDNVMVSRDPNHKLHCQVADFGIASNQMEAATLTLQGTVIGTPAYMAPEQAQGLPSVGPGVDLYAIGVMLYELLCHQLPFTGTVQALLYQKIHKDPPPLPNAAELPAALPDVVMKMIARQPEERFTHARDVLAALEPHALPPVIGDEAWASLREATNEVWTQTHTSHSLATISDATTATSSAGTLSADPEHTTWCSDAPPSRLWGRDELLDQLDGYARSVEEGSPQVVLLSGGLGVGKSSLMEEMAIRLQEQGRFQVMRTAYSSASPIAGGLRGAVESSLGVRGRSAATLRRAVQEHLRRTSEDDPDEVETLIQWLRPPQTATQSTPAAAAGCPDFAPGLRYLHRLARTRPVLLLIDDLHQGGGTSAALIEFLLFEMEFEPCDLWVMGAMVSEELSADFREGLTRSSRSEGRCRHIVQVPHLSAQAISRGLRQELKLSTAGAERIAERSGGNPLIARGLVQVYGTDALMTEATERTELGSHAFEGTLGAMLQRILQALYSAVDDPGPIRAMLRALAILGPRVKVRTLAGFLDTLAEDPDFEMRLDLLIERDILVELRADGQDRVELRPLILAEVVLADVGPRERRRMHQRAIQILLDSDDVDPGVLGDHHHALGQVEPAIQYWKQAETRALLAGAPFAAAEWSFKLITLLEEPERSIWGVRLGRVLLDAGDPRRAEHLLRPVVDSARPDISLLAADVLCDVYENLGKGSAWTELAARIEDLLPRSGQSGRHAALCALAMWRTCHGDDRAGRQAAEEALTISSNSVEIRRAAQRLAFSCLPALALDRAGQAAEEALDASSLHPQLRARSLRTLGVVRMWQGRGEDSVQLHEQALALARWKGLSSRAALALQDLGDALRVDGRYLAAQERYASSIQAAEALDLDSTVYLVRFKLLMCDIALGQESDLEWSLEDLTGPAHAAGLALARPFAALLLAWSSARRDRLEEARAALDQAQVLEAFQVDPQVVDIFQEVRERIEA